MLVQATGPVTPLIQQSRADGDKCCLFGPICALAGLCLSGITGGIFLAIGTATKKYCLVPYAEPCTPEEIERANTAFTVGIVLLAIAALSVLGAIVRHVGERALNRKTYQRITPGA